MFLEISLPDGALGPGRRRPCRHVPWLVLVKLPAWEAGMRGREPRWTVYLTTRRSRLWGAALLGVGSEPSTLLLGASDLAAASLNRAMRAQSGGGDGPRPQPVAWARGQRHTISRTLSWDCNLRPSESKARKPRLAGMRRLLRNSYLERI